MAERVLLVDDDADFVETLAQRMRVRGIEVCTATSARQGIDLMASGPFDAVVLDLMMPEMDGIEALETLKERQPELEVILLTGHATVSKGVEAMKLGATDFLEKPVDIAALVERIHAAHERRVLLVEERMKDTIQGILKSRGW